MQFWWFVGFTSLPLAMCAAAVAKAAGTKSGAAAVRRQALSLTEAAADGIRHLFRSEAEGVFALGCQSSGLQWSHLHTQLCWYGRSRYQ